MTAIIATEGGDITGTTTADPVILVPAGTVDGNLLIMVVSAGYPNPSTQAIATPSGWTLIQTSLQENQGSKDGILVAYSRIASSEPASYTPACTPNATTNPALGKMLRITGHDPVAPINISAKTDDAADVAPSVTTTVADCLILVLVAEVRANPPTITTPGTLSEQWNFNTDPGEGLTMVGATKVAAVAGATGTETFDAGDMAITLAIAPALLLAGSASGRTMLGVG